MNKKVESINYYLIPGMGADERLFSNFSLQYGTVTKLNWIPHEDSRNLSDYAALMSKRVTTENNIIIGSSMGGMVAVEMAKIINPLSTILVSAPTGRHQFPRVLKTFDFIKLHRALTPSQVMRIAGLADLFMGFKTPEQRAMFYDMLKSNGPEFLHFSIGAVLGWKNKEVPPGDFIQLIGTQDKLFDPRKIPGSIPLEGKGHFAAFEAGDQLSAIINEYVASKFLAR